MAAILSWPSCSSRSPGARKALPVADGQQDEWPPVHLGGAGLWVASWLCLHVAVFQDSLLVSKQSQWLMQFLVQVGKTLSTWRSMLSSVPAAHEVSLACGHVPVKPCVCHAQGEPHKHVRSGRLGPVAVGMCWCVRRVAGEYEQQCHHVCSHRFPGRISASVLGSQWGHWGGWGGHSGIGRGAETRDLLGSIYKKIYKKRVVGMVSHGMALGQGLLNRLCFLHLRGRLLGQMIEACKIQVWRHVPLFWQWNQSE